MIDQCFVLLYQPNKQLFREGVEIHLNEPYLLHNIRYFQS